MLVNIVIASEKKISDISKEELHIESYSIDADNENKNNNKHNSFISGIFEDLFLDGNVSQENEDNIKQTNNNEPTFIDSIHTISYIDGIAIPEEINLYESELEKYDMETNIFQNISEINIQENSPESQQFTKEKTKTDGKEKDSENKKVVKNKEDKLEIKQESTITKPKNKKIKKRKKQTKTDKLPTCTKTTNNKPDNKAEEKPKIIMDKIVRETKIIEREVCCKSGSCR